MHGLIRERKEIPNDIWHSNFAMPKDTNVIDTALLLCRSIQVSYYDWQATVVKCSSKLQMIPSLEDFVSMAIQCTQVPKYT